MSAYTVSRLALDAGVSVHIVRDYLLRTVTVRLRSLPCCGNSSTVGARPWPASKCNWPPCQPNRHSTRRVCHEQPRALAV